MSRLTVGLPVCACILALVSCGGAGGLTKAQYDAKVGRLCLVAADGFREMHLTNTIGDYRNNAATIVHIGEHFDKALAALEPPSSIAPEAAAFLAASKRVATDEKDLVAAAQTGTPATFLLLLSRASHDSAAMSRAARATGATGCYIG